MRKKEKIIASKANTKSFYKMTIPSHWNLEQLSKYGSTYVGLSGKTKEDFGVGKPFIPYLNIFNNAIIKDGEFDLVNVNKGENQSLVKNGDLLFTTSSETPEEVGMCSVYDGNEKELYLNSFCFGFRPNNKNEISSHFIAMLFRSAIGRRIIYKLAQGATRYNISKTTLLNENFPLPPLSEQKIIARVLGEIDLIINKTNQLISEKQIQKKYLMQVLLTGKKRLKGFVKNEKRVKTKVGELPLEWRLDSIENITTRIKKTFTPELDKMYKQIGIRSHAKGIFYKEGVTGKELGNKSVFWIEPECFIVNIVFAWEHAIAKTTVKEIGMIASHRFPMYKPKKGIINLDYLLYYFSTPRGKYLLGLASPGGAGRNKTLGQSEFLQLQIPVPPIEEQITIVNVLQNANTEIQGLKNKLEKLKEQKMGLMQILLTGKKRLKT